MGPFAQNRIWKEKTPLSFPITQHECERKAASATPQAQHILHPGMNTADNLQKLILIGTSGALSTAWELNTAHFYGRCTSQLYLQCALARLYKKFQIWKCFSLCPWLRQNMFSLILWIAFQVGTSNSTVNTLTDDKILPAGLCPQRRISALPNDARKRTMHLSEVANPRCCCCCLSPGTRAKPPAALPFHGLDLGMEVVPGAQR